MMIWFMAPYIIFGLMLAVGVLAGILTAFDTPTAKPAKPSPKPVTEDKPEEVCDMTPTAEYGERLWTRLREGRNRWCLDGFLTRNDMGRADVRIQMSQSMQMYEGPARWKNTEHEEGISDDEHERRVALRERYEKDGCGLAWPLRGTRWGRTELDTFEPLDR